MSVFVHAQGIKTVHVVVECPLIDPDGEVELSQRLSIFSVNIFSY